MLRWRKGEQKELYKKLNNFLCSPTVLRNKCYFWSRLSTHVQYCSTDTDRYLQLTVRKFRTDRHSCLIRGVICGWQSVCFARTVILAYGPIFAVDGPYVSHRPSFLLKVRIQSVHLIIAPGPTVDAVRTFRTDRHPCLQTVICAWRSVCRGINSLYKYDWASLFKRSYEASEMHQRGRKRRR